MAIDITAIAIICAVGIPLTLAILITLIFWVKTQRRFKREHDAEAKDVGLHEDVTSFQIGPDEIKIDIAAAAVSKRNAAEYSEESTTNDEKGIANEVESNNVAADRKNGTSKCSSKYYMPAYRRKLNETISNCNSNNIMHVPAVPVRPRADSNSGTNSSAASSETDQIHKSMFEQMVPFIQTTECAFGQVPSSNAFSPVSAGTIHDKDSNDNLIRTLNIQDFGSYPKRPQAAAQYGMMTNSNGSFSSFNSRVPSSSNLSKMQNEESSEVPRTRSSRAEQLQQLQLQQLQLQQFQHQQIPQKSQRDIYPFKNNYDVTNNKEITEEDQYENEFTNYYENKREFIDSLRPKNAQFHYHASQT